MTKLTYGPARHFRLMPVDSGQGYTFHGPTGYEEIETEEETMAKMHNADCPECGFRWRVREPAPLGDCPQCGFCAEGHRLRAEVERLQETVDKLPKTADGVPVVPGLDTVWLSPAEETPCTWRLAGLRKVYSTREAAEAAREKP